MCKLNVLMRKTFLLSKPFQPTSFQMGPRQTYREAQTAWTGVLCGQSGRKCLSATAANLTVSDNTIWELKWPRLNTGLHPSRQTRGRLRWIVPLIRLINACIASPNDSHTGLTKNKAVAPIVHCQLYLLHFPVLFRLVSLLFQSYPLFYCRQRATLDWGWMSLID